MTNAPKEIWAVSCQGCMQLSASVEFRDIGPYEFKYIRVDQADVDCKEAYRDGLERAAEIAKEFDRYDVVEAIRAEKDKV